MDNVRTENKDGILIVTVDRPKVLNALNAQTVAEIGQAFEAARTDDSVKAIILTGGGEKAFVAGADINELAQMTPITGAEVSQKGQRVFRAIERFPKPVIAAINGFALGGGCELALACDFRIAGDNARLGQPEILLGIIPGGGGTQRLTRLVGPARAKELILTGRQVKADEALRIGLVDEVVPAAEVQERALAKAAELAAGAVVAQGYAKAAVDEGIETTLAWGLDRELELFEEVFATEDAVTGVRSFLESGPGKARFSGR